MALLHLLVLLLLHSLSSSSANLILEKCGAVDSPANSTFQSNVNILLTSLSSSSNANFSTNAIGSVPNVAYGLALCRGDLSSPDCNNCLHDATNSITQLCPSYKQAIIWSDKCFLRYSDTQFFKTVDYTDMLVAFSVIDAKDQKSFNKLVPVLIKKITSVAAYNSSLMFATGKLLYGRGSLLVIYGMAQCTRDISPDQCYACLQMCYEDLAAHETGKEGGRALGKNCWLRYESDPFYNGDPTVTLTQLHQ